MVEITFLLLAICYATIVSFFTMGILRETVRQQVSEKWQPLVTIIVPARNEARTIGRCLKSIAGQFYPVEKIEVLIVDDHSRDETAKIVEKFIRQHRLNHFRLLLNRDRGIRPTYKKAAITHAIQFARGDVILTTDADCEVGPFWVQKMVRAYQANTGMVAGLVSFHRQFEKGWFHKIQTLEFAALIFAGVGAAGNGYPLICNGANLSYRREAFQAVGGFQGHDHLPSGDDDLLMQNIHRKTEWKVRFQLDPQSIVYTRPVNKLRDFLNQRARWASKSLHYPGIMTRLMLFLIYSFYASLFLLTPLVFIDFFPLKFLFMGYILKLIPDFWVVYFALRTLKRTDLLLYFPVAELFQIPYILFAGSAGFFKLFQWKS